MMTYMRRLILLSMVLFLPLHAFAEPVVDKLMGTVHIRPNLKLDSQARKDIAAAAARIKKSKAGAVKLRGNYPAASSADDYLSKSVFMAREVERYLKTLLPPRQQIYIVSSQFSQGKKSGQSLVEIFLYPHELEAGDVKIIKGTTLDSRDAPVAPAADAVSAPPLKVEEPRDTTAGEEKRVTSGRPASVQPVEDAARANELVRRAKERAAEKAKRKDDTD